MTRFARAKGSKSSNLKEPDDSTPWEVMKEQLLRAKKDNEDNKNRQQAENQRIENYSNFLKERRVLKRKATWCEFPGTESSKKTNGTSGEPKKLKKKKQKKSLADSSTEPSVQIENTQDVPNNETDNNISKNMKKKKKKGAPVPKSEQNADEKEIKQPQLESKKENKINKNKKRQQNADFNNLATKPMDTFKQTNKQENSFQQKKLKKKRGDQPTRRKEINDNSFQLIINGKDVELMRFDGFPIMKRDAERLNDLKTSMIKKGIPKSEVNRTIKLERRKAEKALARLKKNVCYNCRKGGHNLSECPELKSNIPGVEAADGVCFKCGSTEHRQFECKVQRDKEFRFASCFICKEQGHIARQCPDNPKGLYPNGGSCKLCGDVTHLRKDCPTIQNKEGTSIKLQTLDTLNNVEDIELQAKPVSEEVPKKPKKIKF